MPSMTNRTKTGRQYWRSLDEIADTPEFREFMHHEFPAGAADVLDSEARRHFLKIMAASMALAGLGLSGCRRWPQEKIAPYAKRPAGRIPGKPVYYATAVSLNGVTSGLLATSMDGRPIKVDGNPDHPINAGRSDAFDQASVLGLYDPDRSRAVRKGGELSSWSAFIQEMGQRLETHERTRGAGLAVLSEATSSPTEIALKNKLLKRFPQARWYEYEPLANDQEVAGAELAFGKPYRPLYELQEAKVIVSLDADFLFGHRAAVKHIRDFSNGRRLGVSEQVDRGDETMNRLHCFEAPLTLTGANADWRSAVRSADVVLVAAWLAARILGAASLRKLEEEPAAAAVLTPDLVAHLEAALADLQAHPGASVVMAGPRQPGEVHLLAHLMNAALRNVGKTVNYTAQADAVRQMQSLSDLAKAMADGTVKTLVTIGGNPVYDAPADVDFAALLKNVELTVHFGEYFDETGTLCDWHVNRAHYLEAWGDGRSWGGSLTIAQPLIQPLFDGRSTIELLAFMAKDDQTDGEQLVRRSFTEMTGAVDPERLWRRTLHDGLLPGSAFTLETPAVRSAALPAAAAVLHERWAGEDRSGMEVVFAPDYSVYDGRFANNGWLQELPDPITKLTWDNAAECSPATASTLGLDNGDMIRITVGDRSVETAVIVVPGQADGTLTLRLGYGRKFEGLVCRGSGFDFYPLRTAEAAGFGTAGAQKIRGHYKLATTQDHHAIDVQSVGGEGLQQRLPSIFREATLAEYKEHPDFARHRTHVVHRLSLWDETNLEGAQYAWAMSIDLNACVGCSACVVACQAENNIPIVGKEQVSMGREMHWMRIDRYFAFGEADASRPDVSRLRSVALQPVPCMMCENAPCEQVCPVAATVHDKSGLNVMIYNRCVGTRYCSNNCPYKVRRFNYFDWHRRPPYRERPGVLLEVEASYYKRQQAAADPLLQMQFNPEVTVRMRGIMEKCTYCVQRIQTAKIDAKNEWVKLPAGDPRRADTRIPIADGTIVTACQQACPANAIVFGDLNDSQSEVSKLRRSGRSYQMLEELNNKPRTTYLAKVWNRPGDAHEDEGHSGGGHHG